MVKTKEAHKAEGQGLTRPPVLQRLAASHLLAFPSRASAIWCDSDCRAADAAPELHQGEDSAIVSA